MPDTDTPNPPRHGKSMITAFRAERLANRPTLRAERIAARQSLRAARLGRLQPVAAEAAVEPPPKPDAPAPEPAISPVSMFAQFVETERQALAPVPDEEQEPAAIGVAGAEPASEAAPAPVPGAQTESSCTGLTALGFGPGMTARLHHLGIVSVTDLAGADARDLRNALGDVSDLVNVDFWIDQARTLLRAAA
jgi:predicted flap endonuclease-1-like 5' DNA nuclease